MKLTVKFPCLIPSFSLSMSLSVSASRERILIHNLNKPRQGATEHFDKNSDGLLCLNILSKLLETFFFLDEDAKTLTVRTVTLPACLQER